MYMIGKEFKKEERNGVKGIRTVPGNGYRLYRITVISYDYQWDAYILAPGEKK
jgi:DNA-binding winged helix-turn-helix (wHTH) protein